MADMSKAEAQIAKAVKEAKTAHVKLMGELAPEKFDGPVKSLDPGKAKAAAKKIADYMNKLNAISKFRQPKLYKQMSPETQKDLDWAGETLNALLKQQAQLQAAMKLLGKPPKSVMKDIEDAQKRWKEAYRGLGTIKKQIDKGWDPAAKEFTQISVLPAILMLIIMGLTLKIWWEKAQSVRPQRPNA